MHKANVFYIYLSKIFTPYTDLISDPEHFEIITQFVNSSISMALPMKKILKTETIFLIKDEKSSKYDLITNKVFKNILHMRRKTIQVTILLSYFNAISIEFSMRPVFLLLNYFDD